MEKTQPRPALSAFLLMLTMSLLSTALSFFVVPVCSDLGFGRGSFTIHIAGRVSDPPCFLCSQFLFFTFSSPSDRIGPKGGIFYA